VPRSADFERIYQRFQAEYGTRGRVVYYAWINKHGFDDMLPWSAQSEMAREQARHADVQRKILRKKMER